MAGNELLKMKRHAVADGLCAQYTKRWDEASGLEDMVAMATDANGMDFMARSFAFGWGMSPDYTVATFGPYINGARVFQHEGYTGEIWCGVPRARIEQRATTTLVACCDEAEVTVKKYRVCHLLVSGAGTVRIKCDGRAYIRVYGDAEVDVTGGGAWAMKRITTDD